VRLLLLGKAAVLAHRFDRPLAAEMDEYEQHYQASWSGEPLLLLMWRTIRGGGRRRVPCTDTVPSDGADAQPPGLAGRPS
jgi:hypothetical protein